MSTVITVGSGLGGFSAIAAQPTYGGSFVTPTRPIYGLKSNKATHDPHIVQGGPYLRYGEIVDAGAAHVQTWQDAKGTMVFDAMSTGLALLLASSFGSGGQLIQSGSTAAYELGGSSGIHLEAPESHNVATWETGTLYANVGEIVLEGGKYYENIAAVVGTVPNKGKKPSTESTYWKALAAYVSTKAYAAGEVVTYKPTGGLESVYTALASTTGEEPASHPTKWQVTAALSGCSFDMQLGVPTNNGELTPWNYHSCVITKAELVFDRTGLVACTLDWDAQYVEPPAEAIANSHGLITPTIAYGAVPFSMGNSAAVFQAGAPGALATLPGVRKCTVTLERKLAVDRIYLGNVHKEVPSTNGIVEIMVAAETDYTNQAKALLETFLKNEAQGLSISAVGAAIGTSGKSNTLTYEVSNAFIQTGGEAPLDGPDIVKNTVNLKGTVNTANAAPVTAKLITADEAF